MEKGGIKKHRSKIIAGLFTLLILSILIFTGPAQAFILGLSVQDTEVEKGEEISFTASAEIGVDEFLEIDYFALHMEGFQTIHCEFDRNGTPLSGCNGITIIPQSSPPYQYGYGFTDGKFKFKILLDTNVYSAGIYETSIWMILGYEIFKQSGEDVVIRQRIGLLEGCSIRGEGGTLIVELNDFGDGKINFHIPLGNAANGKGFLTGQKDKKRFSYNFEIISILADDETHSEVWVYGEYKINGSNKIQESGRLGIDKLNNKVSLTSTNINLRNIDITFKKMCGF